MKLISPWSLGLAALASIAFISTATAAVTIDWVTVGNAGNAADTTGYGAVTYNYQIAKNETTIAQYVEFLNAVAKTDTYNLYNDNMGIIESIKGITRSGSAGSFAYAAIGSGDRPITLVSWFDAARYTNWLHNGQPVGAQGPSTTEDGAYTLNGATSGLYYKNPDAKFWIPSENEWYKAAYYDPTKIGGPGYWIYPTQSNSIAGNTIGTADSANYNDGDYVGSGTSTPPSANALTNVGAYGLNSQSYYGTNDQGGNVREWNDSVSGLNRALRGGSWSGSVSLLASSYRGSNLPAGESSTLGFRVAGLAIPEPSTSLGLASLLAGGLFLRRRQKF